METATATVTRFTVGATYAARSFVDSSTVYTYTVESRTAKFVTLRDHYGEVRRVGVRTWTFGGVTRESASPDGSYSMAPVIDATDPVR